MPGSCGPIREAQSKWGRHCCRPHSHRYVAVFLQPKFKGRRLGIRCFPFCSSEDDLPVLSPALAPASGSTLQSARSSRVAAEAVRLPSPAGLQQAAPQPDFPVMARASNGCIAIRPEGLVATPPSASDRVGPARNRTLRVFVIDPPCVWREPSARGSLKSRGQVPLRLPGSEFPKSFKSLNRRDRKLSLPFR